MSADDRRIVSRRSALAGLAATLAAGCSRIAYIAANVPAAFGAYRRHADIAYGTDPQHRLDYHAGGSGFISTVSRQGGW